MLARGVSRRIGFALHGLPPGARFTVETLDRGHGNVIAAWRAMGEPEPPSREQTRMLQAQAMALARTEIVASSTGTLTWDAELAPWTCVLLSQV